MNPAVDSGGSIDRGVAEQAARWLARLGADNVTAQEISDCEAWRARESEHERAWQRAIYVSARMGIIPAHIGKPVLLNNALTRRSSLKALALLIAAPSAAWLTLEATPWRTWTADLRTATGQRRDQILADGTQLLMNTASAVDVRFDDAQRLLILRAGEILVVTAPDAVRPFRVLTEHGMLRALGTRFAVRESEEQTSLSVFEGRVEIRPHHSTEVQIVEPGEQTTFSAKAIALKARVEDVSLDWVRGVLRAQRMPLSEFLAELSRYRKGLLRCDPAVAKLPVSGLFALDDTDTILRNLAETLPINVRHHSRWWTVIEPR